LFPKIFLAKWNQILSYRDATKAPDFRPEKFQMEPNILNKSLSCTDTDESEVLHFGDGILAGIVYFGFRNWMGSQSQRSNKKPLQKNTKRTKTGEQ
jgi:hypothetical protein